MGARIARRGGRRKVRRSAVQGHRLQESKTGRRGQQTGPAARLQRRRGRYPGSMPTCSPGAAPASEMPVLREQPPRLSLFPARLEGKPALGVVFRAGPPRVPPKLAQAVSCLFRGLWGDLAVFFFPLAPIPPRLQRFRSGRSVLSNSGRVIRLAWGFGKKYSEFLHITDMIDCSRSLRPVRVGKQSGVAVRLPRPAARLSHPPPPDVGTSRVRRCCSPPDSCAGRARAISAHDSATGARGSPGAIPDLRRRAA